MLERGASVEAKDEDGGIPLHDACAGGKLRKKSITFDLNRFMPKISPDFFILGYLEIVQLLIGKADSPDCLKRMLESVDVEGDTVSESSSISQINPRNISF